MSINSFLTGPVDRFRGRDDSGVRSPRGGPAAAILDHEALPLWELIPGVDAVAAAPGMTRARRRDAWLRRALGLSDVLACYAALAIALYVLHGTDAQPRLTVLLLAPFVVVVSKALGLYDRDQYRLRKATIDELPSLLNLAVSLSLGIWLVESVLLSGSLDRPQVFLLLVSSFVLLSSGRVLTRSGVLRRAAPERCLVIGSAADCDRAIVALGSGHTGATNATVVGRIGLGSNSAGAGRADGELPQLRRVIADTITRQDVERVILAPDGCDQTEVLDLIRVIKALGVKLSVLPRLLEVVGSASMFDELDGLTLLGVRQYGLSKSSNLLKRSVDLAAATVLLALLSPALAVIAVAIKLDSRGSVFFRQRRIGRRGQLFDIVKFRSMVPAAEQIKDDLRAHNEAVGGLFKMADDPRITRVGRLLRKTSLDELPQLINVLRGEMSLVGPRPLVPDEDALIEGWRRRRLAVKPGMTGLWQIFGSSRIPMQEMVKLDYMYGANWSLWLDLKILLRTVPYVIRRRGI